MSKKMIFEHSSKNSKGLNLNPLASRIEIERSPIFQWSMIALLIIFGILLETTVFSSWKIFGASPTFGYVAVAAVAYYAGANTGFIFGFFAGLGADFFYRTPLGVTALSMLAMGLFVGLIQTGMMRPTPIAIPLLAFGVSVLGNSLYILLSVLLGLESLFNLHTAYVILVSSLINMVASPFIFALTRKLVGAPAWKNR